MMTDSKYSYISSSMVKGFARWGGSIDEFVPCDIIEVINKNLRKKAENKKNCQLVWVCADAYRLNQWIGGYNGMEVLEIIDMLEDVVEKSMAIPFAGRAVVDREELLDLIQEIRLNLPGDLKQAKWVRRSGREF